jgi:hypothetical protein
VIPLSIIQEPRHILGINPRKVFSSLTLFHNSILAEKSNGPVRQPDRAGAKAGLIWKGKAASALSIHYEVEQFGLKDQRYVFSTHAAITSL